MAIARSSFASRASSGARCAISRIVRNTPPALRVLKKSIACSARATSANNRSSSAASAGSDGRRGALRQCQLIEHDDDSVSEIERGVPRIAGNGDDAVTPIERLVRKPLVLASEEQRDGFSVAQRHDFTGSVARTLQIPLRGPPARRKPDDVHAVPQRFLERRVGAHARQYVLRLVRDSLHPVGLVLARIHEPEVAHAKVLHPAYDMRDVDEILRLVKNDDDHPTSSSTPRRAGSWRSPRSHTHPPPPLQTNCPTRRTLPGSISLMMRSKWTRPPACGWMPAGQGMATVTQ